MVNSANQERPKPGPAQVSKKQVSKYAKDTIVIF